MSSSQGLTQVRSTTACAWDVHQMATAALIVSQYNGRSTSSIILHAIITTAMPAAPMRASSSCMAPLQLIMLLHQLLVHDCMTESDQRPAAPRRGGAPLCQGAQGQRQVRCRCSSSRR